MHSKYHITIFIFRRGMSLCGGIFHSEAGNLRKNNHAVFFNGSVHKLPAPRAITFRIMPIESKACVPLGGHAFNYRFIIQKLVVVQTVNRDNNSGSSSIALTERSIQRERYICKTGGYKTSVSRKNVRRSHATTVTRLRGLANLIVSRRNIAYRDATVLQIFLCGDSSTDNVCILLRDAFQSNCIVVLHLKGIGTIQIEFYRCRGYLFRLGDIQNDIYDRLARGNCNRGCQPIVFVGFYRFHIVYEQLHRINYIVRIGSMQCIPRP